ncbi:hypothetical protein ACGFX4_09270 [Kitasatospora sp. NPDC048365]|uniref:hypothetical protein n=1 Tax=Kitasatospora sp. NPDC048365 TaxID=3364050 RepID=UPI00372497DE
MAERLFRGLTLPQLMEDHTPRPVTLGAPHVWADADGAYVVYRAAVPFEGSAEVLGARPQSSGSGAAVDDLEGDIRGSVLHLSSGPQDPSGAGADNARRWAQAVLRRIRSVLEPMNEAVARTGTERASRDIQDGGAARLAARQAAERVNAELRRGGEGDRSGAQRATAGRTCSR